MASLVPLPFLNHIYLHSCLPPFSNWCITDSLHYCVIPSSCITHFLLDCLIISSTSSSSLADDGMYTYIIVMSTRSASILSLWFSMFTTHLAIISLSNTATLLWPFLSSVYIILIPEPSLIAPSLSTSPLSIPGCLSFPSSFHLGPYHIFQLSRSPHCFCGWKFQTTGTATMEDIDKSKSY